MAEEIVTARLVLRRFAESDAADLLRLRTSARVFEFLKPDSSPATLEGAAQTIREWTGIESRHPGYGSWRVGDRSDRFIGTVFLVPGITRYPRFGGLSLPETWGGGYALESSAALLEFGFACLRVTGIIAYTQRGNRSARSALELCGFQVQTLPSLATASTIAFFLSLDRWRQQRPRLILAKNATDPRALLRSYRRERRGASSDASSAPPAPYADTAR